MTRPALAAPDMNHHFDSIMLSIQYAVADSTLCNIYLLYWTRPRANPYEYFFHIGKLKISQCDSFCNWIELKIAYSGLEPDRCIRMCSNNADGKRGRTL